MSPNEKAAELGKSIISTKEFAELRQAKQSIDRNRELKRELDQLFEKQREVYSKVSSRDRESGASEVNKRFSALSKHPEVNVYLKASEQFNELLARTYKTIGDYIDSGLK